MPSASDAGSRVELYEDATGTVDVVETPNQQRIVSKAGIPTNLACYMKAEELLWFKMMIEKIIFDEGQIARAGESARSLFSQNIAE